jgi:hypothetical protein
VIPDGASYHQNSLPYLENSQTRKNYLSEFIHSASPTKKPDWAISNRALEKRVAATLSAPFPAPLAGQ